MLMDHHSRQGQIQAQEEVLTLQQAGEFAAINTGEHITPQGAFAVALLGQVQQPYDVKAGLVRIQGCIDMLPDTLVIVAG